MDVTFEENRSKRLLLSALIFVFGLQSMRFLFASLTWYLRDTLGIGVLNLVPISLAPFVLAALLPIVARWLGPRRALWVGVGLLILARLVNQISTDPGIDFWMAAVGTLAFVGLLPIIFNFGRVGLVGGLLLGIAVDSAIKGLGLSLDLAYQPGWRSVVAVAVICLAMIWALLGIGEMIPQGITWGQGAILLSVAPFLFVQSLIFQSQGWTSSVAGMSGSAAQFRIAVLNVGALYLASRLRGNRSAFGVSVVIVTLAVVSAEGDGSVFNVLSLLAVPLAGVVWSGLVPEPKSDKMAASGFYLVSGLTLFLILGLAYYLPLDMNLGFGQTSVRLVAALLLFVFGVVGLFNIPASEGVGRTDWLLATAAALLPAIAFVAATNVDTVVATTAEEPIRFMSYNLHSAFNTEGNLDVEAIARVIEDTEADVIGFQEMSRGRLINANTDLITLLQLRLGFEHVAFFGTADPVWGNAVFSRYPISKFATDYLPLVGTPLRRGYLGAAVEVGDKGVVVISTHLQHVNDSTVHDDDPEADLLPVHTEQIKAILDNWAGQTPAVLMGDFNARPDWAQIDQITGAGWIDSWTEAGLGEGFTSNAADPRYRIDYIFHTADMTAVDAGVIQSTASDHFPVVADLSFTK